MLGHTRGTMNGLNSSMRKSMYNRIIPTNTTMNATLTAAAQHQQQQIAEATATQVETKNIDDVDQSEPKH